MKNYKTQAVVLKSFDFNEADRVITLFSDSGGKIKAVAKGVRRTKSRFGGRLEPLNYVDLMLVRGRNLDTITGADLICSFNAVKADFNKMSCGFAMIDLLDKMIAGSQPERAVFHCLLSSLELLDNQDVDVKLMLAAFDLKVMSLAGYRPNLDRCVVCGRQEPDGTVWFNFDSGCLVCGGCARPAGADKKLSLSALNLVRTVLAVELDGLAGLDRSERAQNELSAWVRDYIDYHVGIRLKSREYLRKVDQVESG